MVWMFPYCSAFQPNLPLLSCSSTFDLLILSATNPCSLPLMIVHCQFTHTAIITNYPPLNYNPTPPTSTHIYTHKDPCLGWMALISHVTWHVLLQLSSTKVVQTIQWFDDLNSKWICSIWPKRNQTWRQLLLYVLVFFKQQEIVHNE